MTIHASCVLLARAGEPFDAPPEAGILILGSSGSGKSDLALRLIERGAVLVSDDRTELFVSDGRLHARAPAALTRLIEVRGVGVLELPHVPDAPVSVVIHLCERTDVARLPESVRYEPPPELNIDPECSPPLLYLAAQEASAPAKVIAAAAAHAKALFRNEGKPGEPFHAP